MNVLYNILSERFVQCIQGVPVPVSTKPGKGLVKRKGTFLSSIFLFFYFNFLFSTFQNTFVESILHLLFYYTRTKCQNEIVPLFLQP